MIRILPGILLRVAMARINTSAPGVNEKPSAVDSVKTGDENNLAAPIAGMAASCCCGNRRTYCIYQEKKSLKYAVDKQA